MKLPTEEQLEALPLRLIVAYAARCAKRVLPIVLKSTADAAHKDAVKNAVVVAMHHARSPHNDSEVSTFVDEANNAARFIAFDARSAANKAANDATRPGDDNDTRFVAYAARSTASAADAASAIDVAYASRAANTAARTACDAGPTTVTAIIQATISDFESLTELAKTSEYLSIDLPLWPNGAPDWYTKGVAEVEPKRKVDLAVKRTVEYIVDGERLKVARQQLRLSHAQLAIELDVPQPSIAKAENGMPVSKETVEKLAVFLQSDLKDITLATSKDAERVEEVNEDSGELPTKEQLAKLPPRLVVAYAARCAQRMLPFALKGVENEIDSKAVRQAVNVATAYARNQDMDAANAANAAYVAANAANAKSAVSAANAAANAAYAATSAATENYVHAIAAANSVSLAAANTNVRADAISDFAALTNLAKSSDYLSIDLPLWPNGEPKWYTDLVEELEAERDREVKAEYEVGEASELPTKEQLGELPPRLIVAYAARCAQRVLLIAKKDLSSEQFEVCETAIEKVLYFACHESSLPDRALQIDGRVGTRLGPHTAARAAARAAYAAADALNSAIATMGVASEDFDDTVRCADFAARAASNATNAHAVNVSHSANAIATAADFDALYKLAKTSDYLSADVPLWPEGEPEWYTELVTEVEELESSGPGIIRFKIEAPPGTSPEQIQKITEDLILSLDEDYRDMGGEGLYIDNLNIFDPSKVEVPQ